MILERGIIPPNALLEKINPAIDTESYNITVSYPLNGSCICWVANQDASKVPTQEVPWPNPGLRRASVNSFGFGGSNTHVVLEDAFHYLRERDLRGRHCTIGGGELEPPSGATTPRANGTSLGLTDKPPLNQTRLLVWSGASEKAVKRVLEGYNTFYKDHVVGHSLKMHQLAYTLAARRSKMLWRSFALTSDELEDGQVHLSPEKPVRSSADVGLAFVFTGQGAQYVDMGKGLTQYPIFYDTLKRIDSIYRRLGCSWSIFGRSRSRQDTFTELILTFSL